MAPTHFTLSAPLTHSDWMLIPGVAWGAEGIHHMLDACKASGWSRVYWRTLDGGRSLYKSRLLEPDCHFEADNFFMPDKAEDQALAAAYYGALAPIEARQALLDQLKKLDYTDFDTLTEAVYYGHQIGLEIHAWVSINEDDHAWGLLSRFAKAHPETRWRRRDGRMYHSQQSFAYPEVRAYKLELVREILTGYAVDGLFMDWIRMGDIRDNPLNDPQGVADRGYEDLLVEDFRSKYAREPFQLSNGDESWVRFRAEPHTVYMRELRQLVTTLRPGLPVAVMVAHPWCYRGFNDHIDGNLRGLLLDVSTWAQEGLIDEAVAAGYYMNGGTPALAYQAFAEELGGKVKQWLYAWVPESVADLDRDLSIASTAGAQQILFWEADYIDRRPNRDELQKAMLAHSTW